MVQFGHRNITNPTTTHAKKVMETNADYVKAIQGFTNSGTKMEIRNLKQLVKLRKRVVAYNSSYMNGEASSDMHHLPMVPPVPRV